MSSVIDGPDTLRRILSLERDGLTRKQIARRLGLDYTSMCRELRAAGYPGTSGVRPAITEAQIAEGIRLVRDEGLTYAQAAARLDVSRPALQRHLFDRGVRVGRRVKLTDQDVERAAELRRRGWTYTRIAREFGVSDTTIRTRLTYRDTGGAAA